MHLENLSLANFKNYTKCELQFSPQINCFVGPNGSGKTNLLDAIHYLSLTKSAFNPADSQNIKYGEGFFMIKGSFGLAGKSYTIQCSLKAGEKKQIKNGPDRYDKLIHHIGAFPLVLISPYDTDIIREGSEQRRKFFDNLLSQTNQNYLYQLIKYNRYLRQRNSLLKQFHERNYYDPTLMDSFDLPLINIGEDLFECRQKMVKDFLPLFNRHYRQISGGQESVDMLYQSDYARGDFADAFHNNLSKDRALQRTTLGIHKDDFLFEIEGQPIKKFGSQGQQKSFVIALKLAQFELIKRAKGFNPILLMDDIFDKLDDQRIAQLMDMVAGQTFGQLFVTDARPERTKEIFKRIQTDMKMYHVIAGTAGE